MAWREIDGRVLTAAEFVALPPPQMAVGFKPQFVVLHNTDNPMLNEELAKKNNRGHWHSVSDKQRLENLVHFYRDQKGWSAGPHLFIHDKAICLFSPLSHAGVHAPSWNGISWGVEVVGNYDLEPLLPEVRANVVTALAKLCEWGAIEPDTMRYHKHDPATSHKGCPGEALNYHDIVEGVSARRNA